MTRQAKLVRWCTGRGGGWFTLSYLLDWLVSSAVLILTVSFTQFWWVPSVRFLPDNFQTLQYPHDPEVLPTWVIGVLTMILPVCIFLVFQIALRSAHDFHHACLGFFETLVFNFLFNSSLQYLSGKYTPDWYDRLRTGTPEIIKHGRLSYPSWHVSTTFASLGFFSMYLAGKLGLFRKNSGHSWKAVIVLVPLFGAALIAITRTLDYHSDFDDVTAGTLLGLLMAKFFYSCNFHSLSSNRSHLPLSRNANALRKNALRADALRASVDATHERLPVRLDAQQIGDNDDDDDDDGEGAF